MKLVKTDQGYVVPVPQDVVDALCLHDGDEVDVQRVVALPHTPAQLAGLEIIRGFRRAIPADYKFDRDEANER